MADYIAKNDFLGAVEQLRATSPRWRKKWFETCQIIYEKSIQWAKEYVLDPIGLTVKKIASIKDFVPRLRTNKITIADDCHFFNEDGAEKVYLIEFFDENNNSICSKIGTTTRTIQRRISEELNSDTYKNMGAVRCVVHRVYDCGKIPAEGLESHFRATYIQKYPNSFQKNDRFIKLNFDFKEADKISAKYLAGAA